MQTAHIDSQPPLIHLPASWSLGRTVDYSVTDAGSGLANVRVVITDPQERCPKAHWDEAPAGLDKLDPAGGTFESVIAWDGRWADGSLATSGEYLAWVKASDQAGNESMAAGRIRVEGKAAAASPLLPPWGEGNSTRTLSFQSRSLLPKGARPLLQKKPCTIESARWEQQQAYQRYRQGERAEPQPEKKSFWQQTKDWLQDKWRNSSIIPHRG